MDEINIYFGTLIIFFTLHLLLNCIKGRNPYMIQKLTEASENALIGF